MAVLGRGVAMKNFLFGLAGIGAGGAALMTMDSPDYDRTIARPPTAVYAAFSALAAEGTEVTPRGDGVERSVAVRVEKSRGESIRYEISFDDRPVVTAALDFAAAEDGRATRLTAELDVNAYELGSAFETEAGLALALVPESYIDRQFAAFMDDMVESLEAGRPLRPLSLSQSGVRRKGADSPSLATRRRVAEAARRDAARPMMRATPMVDPDRAARAYLDGR